MTNSNSKRYGGELKEACSATLTAGTDDAARVNTEAETNRALVTTEGRKDWRDMVAIDPHGTSRMASGNQLKSVQLRRNLVFRLNVRQRNSANDTRDRNCSRSRVPTKSRRSMSNLFLNSARASRGKASCLQRAPFIVAPGLSIKITLE